MVINCSKFEKNLGSTPYSREYDTEKFSSTNFHLQERKGRFYFEGMIELLTNQSLLTNSGQVCMAKPIVPVV